MKVNAWIHYDQLLDRAADWIVDTGFHQTGDDHEGYTIVGALDRAIMGDIWDEQEAADTRKKLREIMKDHLATKDLLRWNNRWYRTQSGVIRALRKAADNERKVTQ